MQATPHRSSRCGDRARGHRTRHALLPDVGGPRRGKTTAPICHEGSLAREPRHLGGRNPSYVTIISAPRRALCRRRGIYARPMWRSPIERYSIRATARRRSNRTGVSSPCRMPDPYTVVIRLRAPRECPAVRALFAERITCTESCRVCVYLIPRWSDRPGTMRRSVPVRFA